MTVVNAPIHPGEHLAEMLEELGVSSVPAGEDDRRAARFASTTSCTAAGLLRRTRRLRIGRALRMTPEFWLNLQRMYDLEVARAKTDLSSIEPLVESPDGFPPLE